MRRTTRSFSLADIRLTSLSFAIILPTIRSVEPDSCGAHGRNLPFWPPMLARLQKIVHLRDALALLARYPVITHARYEGTDAFGGPGLRSRSRQKTSHASTSEHSRSLNASPRQ